LTTGRTLLSPRTPYSWRWTLRQVLGAGMSCRDRRDAECMPRTINSRGIVPASSFFETENDTLAGAARTTSSTHPPTTGFMWRNHEKEPLCIIIIKAWQDRRSANVACDVPAAGCDGFEFRNLNPIRHCFFANLSRRRLLCCGKTLYCRVFRAHMNPRRDGFPTFPTTA
jgi:hypothetical protein